MLSLFPFLFPTLAGYIYILSSPSFRHYVDIKRPSLLVFYVIFSGMFLFLATSILYEVGLKDIITEIYSLQDILKYINFIDKIILDILIILKGVWENSILEFMVVTPDADTVLKVDNDFYIISFITPILALLISSIFYLIRNYKSFSLICFYIAYLTFMRMVISMIFSISMGMVISMIFSIFMGIVIFVIFSILTKINIKNDAYISINEYDYYQMLEAYRKTGGGPLEHFVADQILQKGFTPIIITLKNRKAYICLIEEMSSLNRNIRRSLRIIPLMIGCRDKDLLVFKKTRDYTKLFAMEKNKDNQDMLKDYHSGVIIDYEEILSLRIWNPKAEEYIF